MHNPLPMQIVEALQDLINDIGCSLLTEVLIFYQPFQKFPALYEFCYYIDICAILQELKDFHDVLMRNIL